MRAACPGDARCFYQAVQSLPLSMRTPQNCTAFAKNMACAVTGERDLIELRLAALIDLKVTVAA
jgi:hypothetical protein